MTSPKARGWNRLPLHTQMLIGFVVGATLGIAANLFVGEAGWLDGVIGYVTEPVGQLFLRLLFMLVVPLVFSALILGVVEIGDPRSLGRLGGKAMLWVLGTTTLAVTIGLVVTHIMQPGAGIDPALRDAFMADAGAVVPTGNQPLGIVDMLLNMVPRSPVQAAADNDLIAVMFFSLMFGVAATVVNSTGTRSFVGAVQGVFDISLKLIDWVIRTAPYAVAALLFTLTARMGLDLMVQLGWFVLTAVVALGLQFFGTFSVLLATLARRNPLDVFRRAQPALLTAFSTSSSAATLPTSLKVAEHNLGVPRRVARFVCTLGATINMNGTALYEGVTVLFLAQLFGVDLTLTQQVMILIMCIMGGIGAASVPGGSLPVIAAILVMFNIPPEGLAIILGVDRFLDMCRTTVNIGGDMVGAVVIGRSESRYDHDDIDLDGTSQPAAGPGPG